MTMREYDLIVVGAGGFTGKLVVQEVAKCEHLLRDNSGRRRWAVSGRNNDKIRKALADLPGGALDVIAADLTDAGSLTALTQRAHTIVNLAGPFAPTAPNLIAACVQTRTSYVDLSGEIPLLKDVIDQFHDAAVEARIRIVQMAGWEALPADLTALLASRRAVAKPGRPDAAQKEGAGANEPIAEILVTAHFAKKPDGDLPVSQAVSAGTLSSIVQMLESPNAGLIGRSGALLPESVPSATEPAGLRLRPFEVDKRLISPFFPVAFLNAPIVHRTGALRALERGVEYKPALYREGIESGTRFGAGAASRWVSAWASTALQVAVIAVAHAPLSIRRAIAKGLRKITPASGSGPTGHFLTDWTWTVHAQARTADGRTGEASLDGQAHPGYTATAAMIAEVGLRIALGRVPERYGCLTPALVLGSVDLDPWFVDGLKLR